MKRHEDLDFYTNYNKMLGDDLNLCFMNHGFYPVLEKTSDVFLDTCASLYCYMIDKLENTRNKTVLDVGCGRGGGASLIQRLYEFDGVFACDSNPENIKFCNKHHNNVIFSQQLAENLNEYEDNFFDVLVNIESSHCYENVNWFYKSVNRVLKDGGIFLYCDTFYPMAQYDHVINKYFSILEKFDITSNVADSCEHLFKKLSNVVENDNEGYEYLKKLFLNKSNVYRNNINCYIAYVLKKNNGTIA